MVEADEPSASEPRNFRTKLMSATRPSAPRGKPQSVFMNFCFLSDQIPNPSQALMTLILGHNAGLPSGNSKIAMQEPDFTDSGILFPNFGLHADAEQVAFHSLLNARAPSFRICLWV